MNRDAISRVIFSRQDFDNSSILYSKVALQLQLLLEAGNICSVSFADEKGTMIMIEYSPASAAAGTPYPYWLYPDEAEYVNEYHEICRYEINKQEVEKYENDPLNKQYLEQAKEIAEKYIEEKYGKSIDEIKKEKKKNGGNNNGGYAA